MVLVDSSIWIQIEHRVLRLPDLVGEDDVIATCPIVIHEVLRGTRTRAAFDLARAMLFKSVILDSPMPMVRFEEAARLYQRCRAAAVTPSSVDALVAACAIAHKIPLLQRDRDFEHIARVTTLQLL